MIGRGRGDDLAPRPEPPQAEGRSRREKLEVLYDRARRLDVETRTEFLAATCRDDPELWREVTSLLAHAEDGEAFFDRLTGVAAPGSALAREAMLASTPTGAPRVDSTISHFRILAEIGRGGMGMVYRARDTRLDRDVALKFLPPHFGTQPAAEERLLAEARAAAALQHPNVCTVHEIGETNEGRPFIAMALCDGETLKERLRGGSLSLDEAVTTAVQIARGLAAAHDRGIVHRDVKPGNAMLTADGTVKLLDFGLAKVAHATQTLPGTAQGTMAYMSPEQARGDELDHRTDLWSLGVVLYEMLAGVRPFRGGSDRALLQYILHAKPDPLARHRAETPEVLSRIVERLLEKEPKDRYASAVELLGDLENVSPSGARASPRRKGPGRLVLAGTAASAAAVLLVALIAGRDAGERAAGGYPASPASAAPTLAVLPFTVHGEDLGIWREGMVDLLSTGLDGAGGVRAIASRTLMARWEEEVGNGASADLPLLLRVARRTGASHALVGSAVAAGPEIRLVADVYDLESGRGVGQAHVQGSPDSVLNLVDRLGIRVLGVLLDEESGTARPVDLASVTTSSLPALKAYLEGEASYRRSDYRRAIVAWERAVSADTLFALAYVGLADAYGWSTSNRPLVNRTLDRALHLADRLPPRRANLVRAKSAGWRRLLDKVDITEQAVREYPDDAEAWFELGEAYYHQAGAMRGPEEAERAFRRAAELQPTWAHYRVHILDLAFQWQPDSARVAAELEAHDRLATEDGHARAGRIAFRIAFGDSTGEARSHAALVSLDSETATQVYVFLRHPRFATERDAVFSALSGRFGGRDRVWLLQSRFHDLGITEGRVGDALALRDDPAISEAPRYCVPYLLWNQGSTAPERILDEALASFRVGGSSFTRPGPVNCAGLYAAERGRWGDHAALLAHAREMTRRSFAGGDTSSARAWEGVVREQEAQRLWGRGQKAEALRAFEAALAANAEASWVLWPVGRLALELDQADAAERAYRRLATSHEFAAGPLAYLYLGRIYERTGRQAEAMTAYAAFASAWRRADPELQPLVDEAREAMARLLEPGR